MFMLPNKLLWGRTPQYYTALKLKRFQGAPLMLVSQSAILFFQSSSYRVAIQYLDKRIKKQVKS